MISIRLDPVKTGTNSWAAHLLGARVKGVGMAYLEITLKIGESDRAAAAGVYQLYKKTFLDSIKGATSKELLVRDEDVQVLHGFSTSDAATAYLESDLFTQDVVSGLKPYLQSDPEIRIYSVA